MARRLGSGQRPSAGVCDEKNAETEIRTDIYICSRLGLVCTCSTAVVGSPMYINTDTHPNAVSYELRSRHVYRQHSITIYIYIYICTTCKIGGLNSRGTSTLYGFVCRLFRYGPPCGSFVCVRMNAHVCAFGFARVRALLLSFVPIGTD